MTFQRGSVCAVGGGRSDPECDVRSDELPSNDLEIGHGHDCSECHSTLFVGGSIDSAWTEPTDDRSLALEAFADAVEFFHDHIYRPIDDHHSEHAVRPDKGREYSECVRDWDAETVDSKQFGLSLADETALLDYLMGQGDSRDAILGTGLFTEDLTPLWQGRYVVPPFWLTGSKRGGNPLCRFRRRSFSPPA